MTKYILNTPLSLSDFDLSTYEELYEAARELGCYIEQATDLQGQPVYYLASVKLSVLQNVCIDQYIPGNIYEVTSTYVQTEQ